MDKKKGLYDGAAQTSFSCVTWDDQGTAYTGAANSKIYMWNGSERKCIGTIDCHKNGFVCAIQFRDGSIFSGGKDGCVH